MNWAMSGHDRWHWKAPSSTDHYLWVTSRVWLDWRWWEHGRQNETLRILVGLPILFFQMWHFGLVLRAKRRREVWFALCQRFYLDIALFDRILVIMRQWTTLFGTVKEFGWKDIVSLMRLPRWMWVYPFVICVHWRSGVPWSACLNFLRGFGIKLWWFGPSPVFEGLEMYSLGP
jgi:hypothetical protein